MTLTHFNHDGRARFVTFSTHRRMPVLTNDRFRKIVVDSIDHTRQEFRFRMIAYVLMPEHVHLVLLPNKDTEVGRLVGEIKRISSKRIHELLSGQRSDLGRVFTVIRDGEQRFAFWKRRCYDHNCRSEESVWQKVNYCHNNPVKRGLVPKPEDWVWSSYWSSPSFVDTWLMCLGGDLTLILHGAQIAEC